MHDPRRILIVNPFGIGDVLFSTPLIRSVRRAWPEAYVAYLCNRRTEGIVRRNPHLDAVLVYEKDEMVRLWQRRPWRALSALGDLFAQIRTARFDLVIDLSLGARYGGLLRMLGVPRQVGFDYRHRGRFLSQRLPIDGYQEAHVVAYYDRLLSFLGVQPSHGTLELRVSAEEGEWALEWLRAHGLDRIRPLIGMVPAGGVSWGSGASFRRWSTDGFAFVADRLVNEHRARIVLFGEASDQPICEAVAKRMESSSIDLSGQTTLGQFVALLGRMSLVICNDGGPLHLAVSQGVPTVSIFGPVDPMVYGPVTNGQICHRVVRRVDLPCQPCYHNFRLPPCPYERACLTTIPPEEVMDACREVLQDWRAMSEEAVRHG